MDGNRFLANLKDDFRRGALAQRDALSVEARADAAAAIARASLPVELPATVAGYSPINSELDPYPLMHALAARGAMLALPVIIARNQALIFRAWQPDEGLVRGPFGIFKPSSDADEVDPDIVLVPLALHFLLRALPERVREDARFAAARRRVSPTGPSGR